MGAGISCLLNNWTLFLEITILVFWCGGCILCGGCDKYSLLFAVGRQFAQSIHTWNSVSIIASTNQNVILDLNQRYKNVAMYCTKVFCFFDYTALTLLKCFISRWLQKWVACLFLWLINKQALRNPILCQVKHVSKALWI